MSSVYENGSTLSEFPVLSTTYFLSFLVFLESLIKPVIGVKEHRREICVEGKSRKKSLFLSQQG